MPHQSAEILDSILQYTVVAANALQDLSGATQIPFLGSVGSITLSIIPIVQNAKSQKWCLEIMEEIHHLLCALAAICSVSDNTRSPKMLEQIAQFAQTLKKIHACLKAQQELGKIKRLFKQNEITAQLEALGVNHDAGSTLDRFLSKVEYGVGVASALIELNIDTERRHQELLELISSRSGCFETASSVRTSSYSNSSGSLSVLPASPKIFHGREAECNHLTNVLLEDSARAAIMGPGGMGKSTLAMAVLHHPAIIDKYPNRHFVSCESAYTSIDLISIIGSSLGLEWTRKLSQAIVRHFSQCGTCLLVLDNLETPWEPLESRGQVEEFISLLADIPNMALLITMRGAERPGKVKWTRPFLPVLEPLSPSASRQIFAAVADEPSVEDKPALDELLNLSGNLPLAISLLANIASFEGYPGTLSRWKVENTTLLSDGHDKCSNLEASIILSLGSPRISSSPHAKDLLSLLSLLPDGITQEELVTSKIPIPHISDCKSSLIRTSLAYTDNTARIRVLSPIREYMRRFHPPSAPLCKPLRTHFQDLLALWDLNHQLPFNDLVPRITSNFGNINDLLAHVLLTQDRPAYLEVAYSILKLNSLSVVTLQGASPLIKKLPDLVRSTGDSQLRWRYAAACLRGDLDTSSTPVADAEVLIDEGVQYFDLEDHLTTGEAIMFYNATSAYYSAANKIPMAIKFNDLAMDIAQEIDDSGLKLSSLRRRSAIAVNLKDPRTVIKCVHEARIIGRFTSSFLEQDWLRYEAFAHYLLGNLPRCLELCAQIDEVLVQEQMEGSDRHLTVLDLRAVVHWQKTEYIQARKIYQMIASRTSPNRSPYFHANSLAYLAYADIMMACDQAEILASLNSAKTLYSGLGKESLLCSLVTAELYLYRGDVNDARAEFEGCLSKNRAQAPVDCLAALGDPRRKMYGPIDTLRWAVVYFSLARKIQDRVAIFHALRCLADTYLLLDEEDMALNLFHAALDGATEIDIHRLRAECMVGIGDIMIRRGDSVQAAQMWVAARPLFVKSSQMKEAAAVDARLAQYTAADTHLPKVYSAGGKLTILATPQSSSSVAREIDTSSSTSPKEVELRMDDQVSSARFKKWVTNKKTYCN
ncbi:hypothetical protein C8R44DRAFT_744900 [Mycena epipterygia]|nr:hypothetical protein C8R44DRAFT_744900 [Mycena epipterygia]